MNKILKDFLESDVWNSDFIINEIFEKIEKVKKNKNSNQEFIWNSFELIIWNKEIFLYNQFNEEKAKISLETFENSLKKIKKNIFLKELKKI